MTYFEKAFSGNHQKLLAMFREAEANLLFADEMIAALRRPTVWTRPETRVVK